MITITQTKNYVKVTNIETEMVTYMEEHMFFSYVKGHKNVTLKGNTMTVESEETESYYNEELGDAIIKEITKDTPVAAYLRALVNEQSRADYNCFRTDDWEAKLIAIGHRYTGNSPFHAVSGYKTVHKVNTYKVEF